MLIAYSFPVGLFLVIPMTIALSFQGIGVLISGAWTVLKMLLPLLITIYVFAPWAGRRARNSTDAIFFVVAIAAASMIVVFLIEALLAGVLSIFLIFVPFWLAFALPGSILGSILFIGSCQRIHKEEKYGVGSRTSA